MKTKEEALEDARHRVAEQGRILDTLSPRQAAERVWRPDGPSLEEIADKFARTRCRLPGYPEEYVARQAAAERGRPARIGVLDDDLHG